MENDIIVSGRYTDIQWSEFLSYLSLDKNAQYYKHLIREFVDITQHNPLSCAYSDIVKWWDYQCKATHEINGKIKKLEWTTCNQKLAQLSAFYELAIERGLINFNPVKNLIAHKTIRRISGTKDINIRVTEAMVKKLISADTVFSGYLRVAMLLFMNTAVRISELLNLKYSDIVLLMDNSGQPYYQINLIGKGSKYAGKRITTQVYQQIMTLIKTYYSPKMQKSAYIIPSRTGLNMTRQNFNQVLKRQWQLLFGNTDIAAHDFRHLAITSTYLKTGDILKARDLANHSSVTTTQRYSHIKYTASDVEFLSDALPCDEEFTDTELERMFDE